MASVMSGGSENAGEVVRIGDTIRRPRQEGYEVVEALLLHLESVGYDRAPRFLGVDDEGRQVLSFMEGEVYRQPPWQLDDLANANRLALAATALAELHEATAAFTPPTGAGPRRPLPLPGETWTHADVGYGNQVWQGDDFVGFIDWEFAAPGHHAYDLAALLMLAIRGPRPDADDPIRRAAAMRLALHRVADAYGLDDRSSLPEMMAIVAEDAIRWWRSSQTAEQLAAWQWRADWVRERRDWLLSHGGRPPGTVGRHTG